MTSCGFWILQRADVRFRIAVDLVHLVLIPFDRVLGRNHAGRKPEGKEQMR
jgi:hypothetical protein